MYVRGNVFEIRIYSYGNIQTARPGLGRTHPHMGLVPGVLLSHGEATGREAEDSPAFRPEGKNEWSFTSPDSLYLYSVHRDIFTFTLTQGVTF